MAPLARFRLASPSKAVLCDWADFSLAMCYPVCVVLWIHTALLSALSSLFGSGGYLSHRDVRIPRPTCEVLFIYYYYVLFLTLYHLLAIFSNLVLSRLAYSSANSGYSHTTTFSRVGHQKPFRTVASEEQTFNAVWCGGWNKEGLNHIKLCCCGLIPG